jgi:hypothetical protein
MNVFVSDTCQAPTLAWYVMTRSWHRQIFSWHGQCHRHSVSHWDTLNTLVLACRRYEGRCCYSCVYYLAENCSQKIRNASNLVALVIVLRCKFLCFKLNHWPTINYKPMTKYIKEKVCMPLIRTWELGQQNKKSQVLIN